MSKTKLALKKREKFKSIMCREAAGRTAFILLSFVRGVCYLLCLFYFKQL